MPSSDACPLTSDVMVANREGDLELYAVHDTPVHTPWSVRGELAMGIGRSYAFIPAFHEPDPPPEPWETDLVFPPGTTQHPTPHSVERPLLDDPPLRGRGHATPPTFGRGDEDGFPALPVSAKTKTAQANLAATRPNPIRAYSPAALTHTHFEHGAAAPAKRVDVSPSPARVDAALRAALGKSRAVPRRSRASSPMWGLSAEMTMQHVVEGDISMVMRKRVIKGYGLLSVRVQIFFFNTDFGCIHSFVSLSTILCWSKKQHQNPAYRRSGSGSTVSFLARWRPFLLLLSNNLH